MKTNTYSKILALKSHMSLIVSRTNEIDEELDKITERFKKQDKIINELLDAKGLVCGDEQYNKMNTSENEDKYESDVLEEKYQELKAIIDYCYEQLDKSKELFKEMDKLQDFYQDNLDKLLKVQEKISV